MKAFDQAEFNEFILKNGVIGFFETPLLLKSGRKSNWYVNWRTVAEDAFLLERASDFVLSFTSSQKLQVDTFYGVPEGATKLGLLTQYKLAKCSADYKAGSHVLSMGRTKAKEHGAAKDKHFLGVPRGRVVVLEDVTTTGGSLLQAIETLQDAKVEIVAAIGLTNRMELRDDRTSVKTAIAEKGVPYYAMSSAAELLLLIAQRQKPSEKILKAIEDEFAEYGEVKVKF